MTAKTAAKPLEGELFNPGQTEAEATAGKPSRAVAKRSHKAEPQPPAPVERVVPMTGFSEMLATFERLAVNPNVNPDSLSKLLDVQERMLDRNAQTAFNQAFVEMQPELPEITKDGRIIVREKTNTGKRDGEEIQNTPYAKWDKIVPLIKPVLRKFGFALSHRIASTSDGQLRRVTAILRHDGGWVDDSCYFDVGADTSGSKNNIQGWASSVSYAKRHTSAAVLNIVTKDEDDDGKKSGKPVMIGEPMTAEQLDKLIEFAVAVECGQPHLLKHLNGCRPKGHPIIDSLELLPASRHDEAIEALKSYDANKRERDAKIAAESKKTKPV